MTARSPWRLAAVLFLCLAVPILAFGTMLIVEGLPRMNEQSFGVLVAPIGAVIAFYGVGHLASAYFIWRERRWALGLGFAIASLGAAIAALVLPNAFNDVYTIVDYSTIRTVNTGPELRSVLIGLSIVPYVSLLFLQIVAASHWGIRPGDSGQHST